MFITSIANMIKLLLFLKLSSSPELDFKFFSDNG
jgi:hypothetical protein